ncbi:hypothetical protein KJ633_01320 [bacterium]|nr:hypothetical protein [bacterium]
MKKIFSTIEDILICGLISTVVILSALHIFGLLDPPFAPLGFIIFIIFSSSAITLGVIARFNYLSNFKKLFIGFFFWNNNWSQFNHHSIDFK